MDFKLPELGEGVHEGELVKWCIQKGSTISVDQPLCEVMTDKATIEIPSSIAGTIEALLVKPGEIVTVGQTLARFTSSISSLPLQHTASNAKVHPLVPTDFIEKASEKVLAAPIARKRARQLGIALQEIKGTGPRGRVLLDDIEQHTTPTSPTISQPIKVSAPTAAETRISFLGLRKKIATKMRQSLDTAAHFTLVERANVSDLVVLRTKVKALAASQNIKLTYLPFVIKAMTQTLKHFPMLNSSLDEVTQECVIKHHYHLSLSVQTDDGLVAPVLHHADQLSIFELAKSIAELADKARKKKLTITDLTGGTITLTNVGSIGGLFTTPIINYPEVAIFGFNSIVKEPMIISDRGEDKIVVGHRSYFSLTSDHRVIDGATAAEFMKAFVQRIENPELLLFT